MVGWRMTCGRMVSECLSAVTRPVHPGRARADGWIALNMAGRPMGWVVVVVGLAIAAVGLLMLVGGLSWFGRLPGNVRVERQGFAFYAPLTSMILLSVVLT